jgi:xylulokinase
MGESGVLVDAHGEPLCDIIAWYDSRTLPQMEWIGKTVGEARIAAVTGLAMQPIFTLNKLLWLKQHEPDAYQRAARWLHVSDYVAFLLCGVPATDYSLASRTMGFDLHHLRWADDLIRDAGIDDHLFPPAIQAGTRIGSITRSAASLTGLPEGIAVATGGQDHVCGAFAAGVTIKGRMLDSLGTAECLFVCTGLPLTDPLLGQMGFTQGAHVVPGAYYVFGGVHSSGGSVEWLRDLVGRDVPLATLIDEASSTPAGSLGAMYLPHLLLGDPPNNDSRSRGALVGLSASLGRGAIARAVLEGIAFEARAGYETLLPYVGLDTFPDITAIGGGSRNDLLLRIKASVMNTTFRSLKVREATSLGAAMLAGIGAGVYIDVADALNQTRRDAMTISPDLDNVAFYDRLFNDVFKKLYPATAEISHSLYELSVQEGSES